VKADATCLGEALESWLAELLHASPILLIIDDLERILEKPAPGDLNAAVSVKQDYRAALEAVLRAFARAQTASRLLLTSRYVFRLPDASGRDRAAGLVRVPLAPMPARERDKQLRAAERVMDREGAPRSATVEAQLARALTAAAGNPGLQKILTRPLLAGEIAASEQALSQIATYRETGEPPAEVASLMAAGVADDSDNALIAFFARLSFGTYRAALSADQARQLAAATLFPAETPIPRAALEAAGAAYGVEAADAAVARLLALGLLDDWGNAHGDPHAAANPLARPLAAAIEPADRPRLARAALPHLVKAWLDADGWFPVDPRGVAAAKIALDAGAAPAVLEQAGTAGAAWYARIESDTRRALALIGRVIDAFPPGYAADPRFLRLGVECADLLGEAGLLDRLLAMPARQSPSGPTTAHAALDLRRAERLRRTGDVAGAETLIRSVLQTMLAAKDERMAAVAAGQMADIQQSRGELDKALRIRREEELPVYERLGDVRARAVTMGQIADILQARGELDEALRIRREEELPVYERLGDVRARAVTMGKVAVILQAQGELDEALRILREEALPVFERLGDARSRDTCEAWIAAILEARAQNQAAPG
jgi:tetratricopeptide (TPR) repeat protein